MVECFICMETSGFISAPALYLVCCGQRICLNCASAYLKQHIKVKYPYIFGIEFDESLCPFCRARIVGQNEPEYISQLIIWGEKGKVCALAMLAEI